MAVIWNNPPRIPSIGGRAARGRGHDAHGPIRHRTGVKPSHRGGRHKSHHDDSQRHNEAEHQEAKARPIGARLELATTAFVEISEKYSPQL